MNNATDQGDTMLPTPNAHACSGRTIASTARGLAIALLACVPASWVQAQTTTDADTGGSVLEEVTVTATRQEEALSRVPISVSVESPDAMGVQGIHGPSDIVREWSRRDRPPCPQPPGALLPDRP